MPEPVEGSRPTELRRPELFVSPEQYHSLLSSVSKMLDTADEAGTLPNPYEHAKIEPTDFYAPEGYSQKLEQGARDLLRILSGWEMADTSKRKLIQVPAVVKPIHELGLGYANVTGTKVRGENIVSASVGTKHTSMGRVFATTTIDLSTPEYFTDLMVSFEKNHRAKVYLEYKNPSGI